ncbi:MAG: septum site-determining protein MinC [Gammaproteobacteria bacterium RIFCSPHIGHO2_12_FULL_45_9]|nr:MAG: septum site-determining protein MinC [Gammaproteobacteria bacterium RIFCSPHIGHO2_12_FULL_45_9]
MPLQKSLFDFKADFMPVTVLHVRTDDGEALATALHTKIAEAPHYFEHALVILDITQAPESLTDTVLTQVQRVLSDHQIVPMGIRGTTEAHTALATALNLPCLPQSSKPKRAAPQTEVKPVPPLIVTKPIRAGTRVYAKGGDLVILSSVNPGAECLADGHIYVYGALKGRALAGAQGNTEARIFCRTLEAELLSIAGYYLVKENIPAHTETDSRLHIYWDGNQIQIERVI